VAKQGKETAEENVVWSPLRDAIQAKDWNRVLGLLREWEKKQEELPGFKDDRDVMRLQQLAETEISYSNLCSQAEESLANNNLESAETYYRNALAKAAAILPLLKNDNSSTPLREYYQDAIDLAESAKPKKAAEGLADILLQKTERLAQKKQFTEARKALEWFQDGVSATDESLRQLFLKTLSEEIHEKAANAIRRLEYGDCIDDGDKAKQTGDYDSAITRFEQAKEIADKANNDDWRKLTASKLEEAWSTKGHSLCKSARASLEKQQTDTDDAKKYLEGAHKCLQKLSGDSSHRQGLQAEIDTVQELLREIKIKPHLGEYNKAIAAIKEFLPAIRDPETPFAARLVIMKTAVENMKIAFNSHDEIAIIDPTRAKNDHLEVQAELNQALYDAARGLLEQSQKQKPPAFELKFCQNAQECLNLLLEEMPQEKDSDIVRQAKALRDQVSEEESFLKLLLQTTQHLANKECEQAKASLNKALAMGGFSQDQRTHRLQDKIKECLEQGDKDIQCVLLLDEAKSAIENKLWKEAEQALLKAKDLRVRDDEVERMLSQLYPLWHDDLLGQADTLLTKFVTIPEGTCDDVFALLKQAKSIKNNTSDIWQKWFCMTQKATQKAIDNEQWPALNGLMTLAVNIPGFENNWEIHKFAYDGRCDKGDRHLKNFQFNDAEQQFQAAKAIEGLQDYQRANGGLVKVEETVKAKVEFDRAMDVFKGNCANCQPPILTSSPKKDADFLSSLDDCWKLLKIFPNGNTATNIKTQLITFLCNVLLEDAEYFIDNMDFIVRPPQDQREIKTAFLLILAECDEITDREISALPGENQLRTCVLRFFEQGDWPDQAHIRKIPWLRNVFPAP